MIIAVFLVMAVFMMYGRQLYLINNLVKGEVVGRIVYRFVWFTVACTPSTRRSSVVSRGSWGI